MKLPAFQFYPGDWLKDANLRRCSHAAKGVWIDILCLMFETEERGVLQTNGIAWTDEEIALAVGGDTATTISAISELTFKGVAKRRPNGALYSKRMVADENKRKLCSEAGKKGGGNPKLTQKEPTFKGESKGAPKGTPKQNPNPSSSSSSSDNNNPPSIKIGFELGEVLAAAALPDVAVDAEEAKNFYDHYASQNWLKSNGQPVSELAPALRNWKRKRGKFEAPDGKPKSGAAIEPTLKELKAAYAYKVGYYTNTGGTELQAKAMRAEDIESFKRYVDWEFETVLELARHYKRTKSYKK